MSAISNYSPVYDPGVPRSVSGVYPARYTSTAMIQPDGLTVVGWVKTPAEPWTPQDVLWTVPGAKSGPDRVGEVVDVLPGPTAAWVRTQLDKRNRWLDGLRARVADGSLRLDAIIAKLLGLPLDAAALIDGASTPESRLRAAIALEKMRWLDQRDESI